MADLIFVAVIVAFFALCVAYIRWCDRVVGPDKFASVGTDNDLASTMVPATSPAGATEIAANA